MFKVDLGREYWPLNEVSYAWLQKNAPTAPWIQWAGNTHIEFEDLLVAKRFKKYMRMKLHENQVTKRHSSRVL